MSEDPSDRLSAATRWARRALGGCLVLLALLPTYLFLTPESGIPAREAVRVGAGTLGAKWMGIGLLVGAAAVLAVLLGRLDEDGAAATALERVGDLLRRPSAGSFAGGAGLLAAVAAAATALIAFGARPHLLDTTVQYVHARYLAEGMLAGPRLPAPEFWSVQFMLETPEGWVSQYPPGQIALLAAGFVVGLPWLVGPVLAGAAVVFAALSAERLLPEEDGAAGRAGLLLAALSPFFLLLAGANLSHVGAAAGVAAATWFALEAARGRWAWSLAAGAAAGAVFTVRPLTGVLVAGGTVTAVWLTVGRARPRETAGRLAGALGGAVPFVAGVGAYNLHFFGSPLRFGYLAAAGPSHAPGFHLDPWGRAYGPVEALGHTGTELLLLDAHLAGVLLPAVTLVGLYLLVASRIGPGGRIFLAWCLLPVVGAFVYWHHDLVLGPRMLGAGAPAWALLAAVGGARLVRRIPDGPGGLRPRSGLAWTLVAGAAVSALILGPSRVASTAGPGPGTRLAALSLPDSSVVFVHEDWPSRIGASLHARGLRLDTLRSLMRRHRPCSLHLALHPELDARERGGECRRQARADRFGSLDLAPFLWQGSLPGLEGERPLLVRDLGPEANGELMRRYPGRRAAAVLLPAGSGGGVRSVGYERAMEMLWSAPEGSP